MARLIVKNGSLKGQEYELTASQVIGRLPSNEIPVTDTRMSRRNTRIVNRAGRWWVEDLESKNGTFLNGESIDKAPLEESDELRVGETLFSFIGGGAATSPAAAAPPAFDVVAEPRMKDVEVRSSDIGIGDKPLTFSKHAGDTRTSLVWLRQDLGQRDGAFRFLLYAGVVLLMVGLFWLIQLLVAGE